MSHTEKKKLSLLVLTACALIFLISQIIRLVDKDIQFKNVKNNTAAQVNTLQSVPVTEFKKALTPNNTNQNNDYLAMLNQYQFLQMEHKLLDEQVAVARLRSELVQLNAQNANATKIENSPLNDHYQLVYLGQQNQQWFATLVKDNNYQTVQAGEILADGSKILSIDQDGVNLLSDQAKLTLSFNDSDKPSELNQKITAAVSSHIDDVQKAQNSLLAKKIATTNQTIDALAQKTIKPALPKTAIQVKPKHFLSLDEILLLELPPQNYTIRIAQDDNLSDLEKLSLKFHLNPKALLFDFKKNNQTQHVLVFGNFATQDQAEDALNQLPQSLMRLSPQIISLQDVQRSIKTAG